MSKRSPFANTRALFLSIIAAAILVTALVANALLIQSNKVEAVSYGDFRFAALGDWRCLNSNINATISQMSSRQPERVLGLGDYSYRDTMDCWHDSIKQLANTTVHAKMHYPTTVAIGNHEDPNCPNCGGAMLSFSGRAAFDQDFGFDPNHPTYYSFDQKGVHFVVLDPNIANETGSAQYNFVSNDLAKASKNQSINWIVVYFHQPMYTSKTYDSTSHQCSTDPTNQTSLRSTYQPLFDLNRVDLVLQGHIHFYERMKPLSFNALVTDNGLSDYTDPRGQVFVTVGTGGGLNSFCSETPAMRAKGIKDYGFLQADITDSSKKFTGQWIKNNGSALDTFSITHSAKYNYFPFWTFNGANYEYQNYASSMNLSSFSVATWFQTNENYTNKSMKSIIANRGGFGSESAGQNMNYGIWMQCGQVNPNLDSCVLAEAGKLQAGFEASNGANWFVTSQNKYNDGRWHYAVVTFDNSGTQHPLTLYIDGKLDNSVTYSSSPDRAGSQPFRIGVNSLNLDRYFKGNADEVRVWNRALTASEVTSQFSSGSFNTTGQVIYRNNSETFFNAQGSGGEGAGYLSVADNSTLRLSQFTAAAWFKTSTAPSYRAYILNKGGSGSESPGYNENYGIWTISGGLVQAGFETSSGSDKFVSSTYALNDGKWHYAAVTYNGTSLALYIDGTFANSIATTATPDNNGTQPVRVGANSLYPNLGSAPYYLTGQVDHVKVWNRGMTQAEISDQYNLNSFSPSGRVLKLDFQ